jgi:DNA repair exonuclease SbcCD nuclease subunit
VKAYALIADVHLHAWSKFSTTDSNGVNTRLRGLLGEIERAALAVRAAGGDTVYVAGDVFHVRGSVAPSVLNPTRDHLCEVGERLGVRFVIVPGNHDLEGKESTRVGSAVTALEAPFVRVESEPTLVLDEEGDGAIGGVVLVPWVDSVADLKRVLADTCDGRKADRADLDLLIHAPIDGVLPHLSGGLDPLWLSDLGFRKVFAGHYHHHKEFCDGRVYSIGALAHHTWSDVGSAAGFLIVTETEVIRHETALPMFIDVHAEDDPEELERRVRGNFARAKVYASKMAEVEKLRAWLTRAGALGVEIVSVPAAAAERTGAVAKVLASGASIEASISEFVRGLDLEPSIKAAIELEALKTFAEAAL